MIKRKENYKININEVKKEIKKMHEKDKNLVQTYLNTIEENTNIKPKGNIKKKEFLKYM